MVHFLYSNFDPEENGDTTSLSCGPHIDWGQEHEDLHSVFSYLARWDDIPASIRNVLLLIFHPIFLLIVVLTLTAMVLWVKKVLSLSVQELRVTQADLQEERHDKMVLL